MKRGSDDTYIHTVTPLQKYLMDCLDYYTDKIPKGSILVHNGDVIQGFRVPLWHRELVTPDPAEMVTIAVEGLRKLRGKCSRAFLTQGTPIHSQDMTDHEESIAKALNMKLKSEHTLEIEGQVLQFVHGRSKTQKYPTGMIESEYVDALRQAAEEGRKPPTFIIRSHMHRSILVDGMGVITPCWQLPTDFAKRSGKSYITTLGGVILHVDKNFVDCEPVKFPLPRSELETVKIR